jgi:2-polyprenyl-3-methyl-5-hydroxy-6-metoxy-1,4-benzoquinol methylase
VRPIQGLHPSHLSRLFSRFVRGVKWNLKRTGGGQVRSVAPAQLRREYDRWHEERDVPEDDHYDEEWHVLARTHLGAVRGLKVIEIGCGRGGFAKYLVEQGADLVAADFSETAVEIARRRLAGSPNCEILVADIQDIPFSPETFDVVVSLETLEHVPDPDRALAELVRVAKVGGSVVITTPNYLSLIGLYRIYLRLIGRRFHEVGQPINHPLFLVGRIRKLRRLGCRIDTVEGQGHYLAVPTYGTIKLPWLERPHAITKWFALNALTVATKTKPS